MPWSRCPLRAMCLPSWSSHLGPGSDPCRPPHRFDPSSSRPSGRFGRPTRNERLPDSSPSEIYVRIFAPCTPGHHHETLPSHPRRHIPTRWSTRAPTGRGAGRMDADTDPRPRRRPHPTDEEGCVFARCRVRPREHRRPLRPHPGRLARRPIRWRRGPVFLGRPGIRPCVAHAHGRTRATEVFRTAVLHRLTPHGCSPVTNERPPRPWNRTSPGVSTEPMAGTVPSVATEDLARRDASGTTGPAVRADLDASLLPNEGRIKRVGCRPRRSPAIGVPEVGSSR